MPGGVGGRGLITSAYPIRLQVEERSHNGHRCVENPETDILPSIGRRGFITVGVGDRYLGVVFDESINPV